MLLQLLVVVVAVVVVAVVVAVVVVTAHKPHLTGRTPGALAARAATAVVTPAARVIVHGTLPPRAAVATVKVTLAPLGTLGWALLVATPLLAPTAVKVLVPQPMVVTPDKAPRGIRWVSEPSIEGVASRVICPYMGNYRL